MTFMEQEIRQQPQVLERCRQENASKIQELTEILRQRDISSIILAARGTSDHAAIYGKYMLELLIGIPVSLAAPSVFTLYGGKMKLENSLVIGISQSGKAADVLEVLHQARAQGALTVSITNDEDSEMAKCAQYHLFCSAGVEQSVAATKTFTAQLYLLAHLAAAWAQDTALLKALTEVPEGIAQTLRQWEAIEHLVLRFRFMEEGFVLARGLNYPIAMESALKIQETCYVRARAYAASDFHHGPFAMIEKDMPVIVYAPQGPTTGNMVQMVEKLKEAGAEVVVVSDDEDTGAMGEVWIRIPAAGSDMISPFYNAVIAQMFACNLAGLKGLNPDVPRGLKKVTITR